jgi:hypothetical protein
MEGVLSESVQALESRRVIKGFPLTVRLLVPALRARQSRNRTCPHKDQPRSRICEGLRHAGQPRDLQDELDGRVFGHFGRAGKLTNEFGPTNALDCRNPLNSRQQDRILVRNRKPLKTLYSVGKPGYQLREFNILHHMTSDSRGNLYTTEVNDHFAAGECCRRVQKFVYKVLAVPATN